MKIGSYQLVERIGVTTGGALYLTQYIPTGTPVLLKLPEHDSDAAGLRHEYALLQSLNATEILRPLCLLEEGEHLALVLEPFAGANKASLCR